MRHSPLIFTLFIFAALLSNAAGVTAQAPATVGTSFTYQGRLLEGSDLATGIYDFQFAVYDATSDALVGTAITREDVVVSDGFFSVPLDFGNIFTGQALALEIAVRPGASTDAYTILSPRQPLTPAPYALALPGVYTQADPPFVGIGRSNPLLAREAFGVHAPATDSYGGMFVDTAGAAAWPFYGYATDGVPQAWHYYDGASGRWILNNNDASRLVVEGNGNVGVGIEDPAYRLDLIGDRIRLRNDDGELAQTLDLRVDGNDVDVAASNGDLFLHSNTGNTILQPFGRNVGVGTQNPAFKLDVAGAVHASSFPTSSDARLKTDVTELSGVLEKLAQIQPVSFAWNARYRAMGRATDHREIGLIAQEVETVFPELVTTWGPEAYRAIDYARLTAVLVKGIQELRAEKDQEIERLRQENADLEGRLTELETTVAELVAAQGDEP